MRHFALIGRKLSHSFSKLYFSNKFQAEGIAADYALCELADADALCAFLRGQHNLDGFNVTIPYKESIIPMIDSLSTVAAEVGAVNCVAVRNGKLIGHNTDIEGIEATLQALDIPPCKALILGTGGAAKAVAYQLGVHNIPFLKVSREAGRGDITYSELADDIIATHHLIVNTTPLGMSPDTNSAADINYQAIGAQHRIFDLVYNPAETLFMRRAAARGAKCIGGELMLHTQAEASWRIWND